MEKIIFKGPYHSSHIDNFENSELNQPGIYIWGFMVDKKFNQINCNNVTEFDSGKMKFIPYYVGIASGKSGMFIKNRLITHRKLDKGVGLKCTRINLKGILQKYVDIDRCLSNIIKNKSNKNRTNLLNNITYFNNVDVLKDLYPSINVIGDKGNHSINLQLINGNKLEDPLAENIAYGGFWFLYCDMKNHNLLDADILKHKLEIIESWTYYKLKGITISKVINYSTLIKKSTNHDYSITSNIGIFKSEYNESKVLLDKEFDGTCY